jgi:hypothetical protein
VESTLRDAHFEGTPASYDYDGEVLNLRQPAGVRPHPEDGREVPMELHVRGFETESDGLLLLAHSEASRYEATGPHLREELFSWDRGQGQLVTTLAHATDLDYKKVASEREADVEVVSE